MSLDITLHPISEAEIKHFVFDVIKEPDLAGSRSHELTADKTRQEFLAKEVYGRFEEFERQRRNQRNLRMSSSYNYATAIIAGFLHPYTYSYGSSLSSLVANVPNTVFKKWLSGIMSIEPSLFDGCVDGAEYWGVFNFEGWGFVRSDSIQCVRREIESGRQRKLLEEWCGKDTEAILHSLLYCVTNKTGLLEASDVVIPFTGQIFSEEKNLRGLM